MPFAQLNDTRLYYTVDDYTDPWREPETVLLHHGFGRSMNFWREWVPLLARDYRVVRIDARGCGDSAVPPKGMPYTLDGMVADALGVMDHLHLDKVHWGAEASGGHVGLALALQHPARVASITLCNTPFQLPQSANDNFSEAEVEQFGLGHWARKTLPNRIDLDPELRDADGVRAKFGVGPASIPDYLALVDRILDARTGATRTACRPPPRSRSSSPCSAGCAGRRRTRAPGPVWPRTRPSRRSSA